MYKSQTKLFAIDFVYKKCVCVDTKIHNLSSFIITQESLEIKVKRFHLRGQSKQAQRW